MWGRYRLVGLLVTKAVHCRAACDNSCQRKQSNDYVLRTNSPQIDLCSPHNYNSQPRPPKLISIHLILRRQTDTRSNNMAAVMNGGGDGALGQLPLEQWFFETPVCTRWWTTATVITGILVQCQVLTPFQLFYSFRAVFHKQQVRASGWKTPDHLLITSTVLAIGDDIHLLRPALPQPPLSHILHPKIRAHARRVRSLSRTFQLATCIHLDHTAGYCTTVQSSVPGHDFEQHVGVHLVEKKPRHKAELPGIAHIQGSMATMGAGGFQCCAAWTLA